MVDITVVMAIYKPNMKWLIEELESIYQQTYRGFRVLVWNDCPDDHFNYQKFFEKHLREIPIKVYTGKVNTGSNGAFEHLTKLVDTKFIAYCDQDDIWMPNKLAELRHLLLDDGNTLAFSDMMVIDGDSKVIADGIQQVRPRQIFYPGKDALLHLLTKNFVTGCTMMMKTSVAQRAIPFPPSVFHDWWLAICAAIYGRVVMTDKPLMKYRIYGGNQSAVLKGISDKNSYYQKRILPQQQLIDYVQKRYGGDERIEWANEWAKARIHYFHHPNFKDMRKILTLRKYNKSTVYFEILLPLMPNFVFRRIISDVKSGKM